MLFNDAVLQDHLDISIDAVIDVVPQVFMFGSAIFQLVNLLIGQHAVCQQSMEEALNVCISDVIAS